MCGVVGGSGVVAGMKKIPTIFERDWDGDRSRVLDKPHPLCGWVFAGEGIALQKVDGTCCLVRDGKLFKRREIRLGTATPPEFESCGEDAETGKVMGWMPVTDAPEDARHREAFHLGSPLPDGTYELVGPKVQGNPEKAPTHELWQHSLLTQFDPPRTFDGLREWLTGKDMEGLVFHHPDGRMAKIKLSDFGLRRP